MCGGSTREVYKGRARPVGEGADDQRAVWDACSSLARNLVLLSLDPDVNYLIDDSMSASAARVAIREHFAPINGQGVIRLLDHLFSMRLTSSSLESVDALIKDYRETHNALAQADLALSDVQATAHVLSILPSSFTALRTNLGISSAKDIKSLPSLDALFTLLRAEALRGRPITGNVAKSAGNTTSIDRSKSVPSTPCPVPGCGQMHWSRECRHSGAAAWRAAALSRRSLSAKVATVDATGLPVVAKLANLLGDDYGDGVYGWFADDGTQGPEDAYELDSGASHDLSGRKEHFLSFVPCAPEPVGGISGNLTAVGVGKVAFKARLDGNDTSRIVMHQVLYVPGIRSNLISISRLGKKGYSSTFGKDARIMQGNTLAARGFLNSRGLYTLDADVVPRAFASLATSSSIAPLTTWHRRLCHLSPRSIQTLASDGHVHGLKVSGVSWCGCNSCQVSKAHRLPFASSSKRATRKLELVHSDLVEISHASLSGRHYGMLFTDDYSRKGWLYLLGHKSDALDAFLSWLPMVELQSGERLRTFRSDNEFTSNAWKAELTKRGIVHQLTQPYTSQHNSRAERPNRTFVEGTIAMLEDSGLPQSFWGEAALTFVLTKNKSPHFALSGNVPDTVWFGRPANVDFLRSFGCLGFMTINSKQERRKKLDPKGRRVILIGYEPNVKAYRLYDPETKKIHVSRDVVFDEDVFPLNPKRDTLGGGQLNSAPLTVRPSSDEGEAVVVPLTPPHGSGITPPSAPSTATASRPSSPHFASPNPFDTLGNDEGEETPEGSDDELALAPVPPPAPRASRFRDMEDQLAGIKTHFKEYSDRLAAATPPAVVPPAVAPPSPARSESPDPINFLSESDATPAASLAGPISAFMAAADQMLGEDSTFTLPSSDPVNYREAMKSIQARLWQGAINKEVTKLDTLHTFKRVPTSEIPAGHRAIGSKFVFKAKKNKHGVVVQYKARLVAQGFSQRPGVDFKDTFAPVAKFTSIRTLIALAARHAYHVQQADIDSAFPQAELSPDEVVFVRPPEGLRHLPEYLGIVLRLIKALYGLKQSGRVWNTKIHASFTHLGYTRTRTDACVYTRPLTDGRYTYMALYVDDILLVGPSMPEIDRVKSSLANEFGIKDLGAAEFILGIQIVRDASGGFWLGQHAYLEVVLERFGMTECRPLSTPMEPNLQLRKGTGVVDQALKRRYLQAIGSVMYAMLGTRPDIAHAVSYLARFSDHPTQEHWNAVIHLLRYIRGTLDLGIYYSSGTSTLQGFTAYSDSDWAADVNTSRSTMGYAFLINGGAISWNSRLQSRATGSSTEAEYLGFGNAGREGVHIGSQFEELHEPFPSPLLLYGDNQGAIALSKEARFHDRTKHIRLCEHIARELVEQGTLAIEYIPTQDMVADIMTKSLPRPIFEKFRSALGVIPMPP